MTNNETLGISPDMVERLELMSVHKHQLDIQSKLVTAERKGEKRGRQEVIDLLKNGNSLEDIKMIRNRNAHRKGHVTKEKELEITKDEAESKQSMRQKTKEIIEIDEGIAIVHKILTDIRHDKAMRAQLMREEKYQKDIQKKISNVKRRGKQEGRQEIIDLIRSGKSPEEIMKGLY